jgi:hypothetical protein
MVDMVDMVDMADVEDLGVEPKEESDANAPTFVRLRPNLPDADRKTPLYENFLPRGRLI